MKLIALIVFVFVLNSQGNYCQWEHIATIGNNDLKAVKFFNEHTGIVAGQGGIWRSTNGGVDWVQVLNGVNMNGIAFVDGVDGVAVGDSGKVFRTLNTGLNWQHINSPTTLTLNSVTFPRSGKFIAAGNGGMVIRTLNGGGTWDTQVRFGSEKINSIIMAAGLDGTGYILGSETNERMEGTINGGTNWSQVMNLNGNRSIDAAFINQPYTVLVVGNNGRIRRSTNYGINWVMPVSNSTNDLNSVFFINPMNAYIAGNSGTILRSTDSGFTWFTEQSGTIVNLNDISFINLTTGWVIGSSGVVLRTGIPVSINESIVENDVESISLTNYPNPFNPITKVRLSLPKKSYVQLILTNVLGETVSILIDKLLNAGNHEVYIEASGLSSGVYYCILKSEEITKTLKIAILK